MRDTSGEASVTVDSFAAQLEALRSTAKWLVAAAAAVGGVLVAGLQLTAIGQLQPGSWRLYAAAISAAAALAAVGFMIWEASTVLTNRWLTLATFTDEPVDASLHRSKAHAKAAKHLREIEDQIMRSQHELFGYAAPTIAELHKRLRKTDDEAWAYVSATGVRRLAISMRARQAQETSRVLRQAARDVSQCANYYSTLDRFRHMRRRLGWAALIVAVSSGVFAYAANPPKRDGTAPAAPISGHNHAHAQRLQNGAISMTKAVGPRRPPSSRVIQLKRLQYPQEASFR